MPPKASVSDLFGGDSSDDEAEPRPPQQPRGRGAGVGGGGPAPSGLPPLPCGPGAPGTSAPAARPPEPTVGAKRHHAFTEAPAPRIGAPLAAAGGGGGSGGHAPPAAAAAAGTVAAMERYMANLARREAAAAADADSDEERRKRAAPLLKETAYDRRKVVAVFTQDGRRGHHLQDFLPPEELARLNATPMRGGSAGATPGPGSAAASAGVGAPGAGLGADNKGFKLLQKMGWREGQGIGGAPSSSGGGGGGPGGGGGGNSGGGGSAAAALPPLAGPPPPVTGGGGLGLGATREGDVAEDDDEFTRYRKRMQLAYKYRPNPLGNPRKAYY